MEKDKIFISKRNEVALRDGLVYKQIKDPRAAWLEASILRDLHSRGVPVPQVRDCRDGLLVLEYLPGEPLADAVERGGYDPAALAMALCDWFAAFYAAVPPGALRGDVNGRNFLYDGAKIYSVDFEERCFGPRARDAGRLAAFIVTYDTRDEARRTALAEAFVSAFAERFGCDTRAIYAEQALEYESMARRRERVKRRRM